MGVSVSHAVRTGLQVARRDVCQQGHGGIEKGYIQMLAPPCPVTGDQRGKDRLHRVHACHEVGNCDTQFHRLAIRSAGNRHQTAFRLDREVIATLVRARAGAPVAGDGTIDQARVQFGQRLVVQTVGGQRAQTKVLNQHVGAGGEVAQDLLPLGRFQV